jgi:tetratricopeptide (TPR) repeat protein
MSWTLHLHSRLRRRQILVARHLRAEQLQPTEPVVAEARLRKITALCRRHLGDRDPDTLDAVLALGCLQLVNGRHDDAVQTLDWAMPNYDLSLESHRKAQCVARAWQAAARSELGDVERAERELRAVVEEARAAWGDEEAVTLNCRKRLASVLGDADKFAEAVEVMADVVRIHTRVLGPDNRTTLCARHGLGHYLIDIGEFDRAEQEFRAAMAPRGRHMSCFLVCTYGFGRIAAGRGQREEAGLRYQEAIRGWTRLHGADYPVVAEVRGKLAELAG